MSFQDLIIQYQTTQFNLNKENMATFIARAPPTFNPQQMTLPALRNGAKSSSHTEEQAYTSWDTSLKWFNFSGSQSPCTFC